MQEEKQVEESAEQKKERSQISIRLQRIEKELHPTMDKKERTIS